MEVWQPIQGLVFRVLHKMRTATGWAYMWLHFNPQSREYALAIRGGGGLPNGWCSLGRRAPPGFYFRCAALPRARRG